MSQADELTRCVAALADLFEVAQQSLGEAANLSKPECRVISVVGQFQPLIMRQISERSRISITNITGIVEKLVKKKFLCRERSDDDRRVIKICLTPEGEKVYAMEVENYRTVSRAILSALEQSEQQDMLRMMNKVVHRLAQESTTRQEADR